MAVTVKIPTQLRAATDGEATARVSGSTVGEVLDALYDRFAELRHRIAEDGGLRRFVNVYVGGEDIRFLDGLDTPVADGDEVTILPRPPPPPPPRQRHLRRSRPAGDDRSRGRAPDQDAGVHQGLHMSLKVGREGVVADQGASLDVRGQGSMREVR
jgi:sulfur-carrier protein